MESAVREDAIDKKTRVAEALTADGKLSAEVIGSRHSGQGLHGPQGVIQNHVCQCFQLGVVQSMFGSSGGVQRFERIRHDIDGIEAAEYFTTEKDFDGRVRGATYFNIPLQKTVANGADVDLERSRRDGGERELSALALKEGRTRRASRECAGERETRPRAAPRPLR